MDDESAEHVTGDAWHGSQSQLRCSKCNDGNEI